MNFCCRIMFSSGRHENLGVWVLIATVSHLDFSCAYTVHAKMKWLFIVGEMIANSQQRRERLLRQTSLSFFLERAPISNFCCATNQNNPHIKYVSCDRPHLLKPCGKYFSWAPPLPFRNFYPLAPPPPTPRNFHFPSVGGGGYGYFLESHNSLHFPSPSRVCRCCNSCSKINMFFHSYHHTTCHPLLR